MDYQSLMDYLNSFKPQWSASDEVRGVSQDQQRWGQIGPQVQRDIAMQLGWDPTSGSDPVMWLAQQGYNISGRDAGPQYTGQYSVTDKAGNEALNYSQPVPKSEGIMDVVGPIGLAALGGNLLAGNGLGGLFGGSAGSAGGAAGLTGWDAAMADLAASGGITPAAMGAAGAGLGNGAFLGEGVSSGVPAWDAAATGAAGAGSGLLGNLGGLGRLAATVGGALLGANDARTKDMTATQTSTQRVEKNPWEPAQNWLQNLITQGQNLQAAQQRNPFDQNQQTAYSNLFNILNAAGAAAPAALQGLGALGKGYDKTAANRTQTGFVAPTYDLSALMRLIPKFPTGGNYG